MIECYQTQTHYLCTILITLWNTSLGLFQGQLVWIQPIRQISAKVCDGSGPIHDLFLNICVCVFMQRAFTSPKGPKMKGAWSETRGCKKGWKSLSGAKQELSFMSGEWKTREQECKERNWEKRQRQNVRYLHSFSLQNKLWCQQYTMHSWTHS